MFKKYEIQNSIDGSISEYRAILDCSAVKSWCEKNKSKLIQLLREDNEYMSIIPIRIRRKGTEDWTTWYIQISLSISIHRI